MSRNIDPERKDAGGTLRHYRPNGEGVPCYKGALLPEPPFGRKRGEAGLDGPTPLRLLGMNQLDDLLVAMRTDLDCEEGDAGPFVPEGEVDSLLVHLHGPGLRVDNHLVVVLESSLVSSNSDPINLY